jgi:hypothetical protein
MFQNIVHFLFFCKKKFKSLFDLAFCEISVRFRRSGHDGLQANGLATACMSGGWTWPKGGRFGTAMAAHLAVNAGAATAQEQLLPVPVCGGTGSLGSEEDILLVVAWGQTTLFGERAKIARPLISKKERFADQLSFRFLCFSLAGPCPHGVIRNTGTVCVVQRRSIELRYCETFQSRSPPPAPHDLR